MESNISTVLDSLALTKLQDKPPLYEFSCNNHGNLVRVSLKALRSRQNLDHLMFNAWGYFPLAGVTNDDWREIIDDWAKPPDYLTYGKKGKVTGINTIALINDLMDTYIFRSFLGTLNDEILVYNEGVYTTGAEKLIKAECQSRVPDPVLTTHLIHEITAHIARTTSCERSEFNPDPYILNLNNGLLDTQTDTLKPHDPYHLSTVRIPLTYDSTAKCPATEQFMTQILKSEHIPLMYEMFGYSLLAEYSMQQAFMLTGDGSNGKTTLLNLLTTFIGKENCSSVSLQQLEESDFAASFLEGKLLNVVSDMSARRAQTDKTMFKRLTGGDLITTQKKFRDHFTFANYAKLIFSAQKPPKVDDDSFAFWRRWIVVTFPYIFKGANADRNIAEKLVTPTELSGLLNLALKGLHRIWGNNKFTYDIDAEEVQRRWTLATKPVKSFVDQYCATGTNQQVSRIDIYVAYKNFCDINNIQLISQSAFGRALKSVPGLTIQDIKHRIQNIEVRHYGGIGLNKDGQILATGLDWT